MDVTEMKVGFIGTGGITSALVKGICGSGKFNGTIYLSSPRGERMQALKELYPEHVVITGSNQEVLDSAEIVSPALHPDVLRKIASGLKFRRENRILHIAAGIKIEEARQWYNPAASVVRSVPLPFSARRIGPVVLYGDDPHVECLLSLVGSVVKVPTERDLEIMAVMTCMMVPYYGLVGKIVEWGVSKGSDFKSSLDYATFMHGALTELMRNDCTEDIKAFMDDNATPGGMNELGLKILNERDAYAPWVEALNKIGTYYGL